jgi:DNA-directed RNA polymerase subunit RPC12/RpoP
MSAACGGDQTRFFAECRRCGARWLVGTGLLSIAQMDEIRRCPHCGTGRKQVSLCATRGPNAVTEPRDGRPMPAKGDAT